METHLTIGKSILKNFYDYREQILDEAEYISVVKIIIRYNG